MITEPVTGISFEAPEAGRTVGAELAVSILRRIAACTAASLQQGAYLADTEVPELLAGYASSLTKEPVPASAISGDFLHFVARHQARKHALAMEDEVKLMQKLLRGRLDDRVFYWSFGPLQRGLLKFYEQWPSMRELCSLLLCPSVYAGTDSIIHVAALNPVAGLVAAEWIRRDLSHLEARDEPFVYPFMLDFPWWDAMQNRHFQS